LIVGIMRRILLHTCCGPCTIIPVERLREQDWYVHGFFFNPNIHPYQEFGRRLDTLRSFARGIDLPLIVRDDYDLDSFLRQTVFREQQRCTICYTLRLEAAARLALKSRFDAFTTTLLYSRHQKHDLAVEIAREASLKFGIPFYYEDFRSGWKEGQERSRTLGMYRQQYCGCIYSERDRFHGGTGKPADRNEARRKQGPPK